MNLRFSPESVRLRVSLEEARALERDKRLVQRVVLPDVAVSMEVVVSTEQEQAATFCFSEQRALASLREKDFLALLGEKPSRDSCIRADWSSTGEHLAEFVFEIDLFSRAA